MGFKMGGTKVRPSTVADANFVLRRQNSPIDAKGRVPERGEHVLTMIFTRNC